MLEKRGMLIILNICLILLLFGVNLIYAEEIGIEIDNNYATNGEVNFIITLYDDNNQKIDGEIDYFIKNYYKELVYNGKTKSGERINFKLPENAYQGPWEISAVYNNLEKREIFNVGELKKVDVKIDGDNLIIKNTGNIPYDNNIVIFIGESHQTARMHLEVGETKTIHLTAPNGKYTVRVSLDGVNENDRVFNEVSLTGNVIGIERVLEGNFFERYPLLSLFFIVILFLSIFIFLSKNKKRIKKR